MQKDTNEHDSDVQTTTAHAPDALEGWRLQVSVAGFAMAIAFLLATPAYDLFKHILPLSWRGTSNGVLGGTIGVLAFVASKLRDDERLGLTLLGKEPASKEHVSYLRNRLLSGVPSGFVLSVVAAAYCPNPTDALLTAAGIVGGASSTFLSTATSAIDAFIAKISEKPARSSGTSRIVRKRSRKSGGAE
ncbi:hypothetical protein FAZ95_07460 [Trinickia violacea]|uniref:Uncharacterized protein n=1 Tax=Trinickia violacea TaxID=2571746 RepID=A0A4P8IMK4_9BURK|nr:hypothetical protein [Trinickia violacea]QCP49037.1 hypothetical protein FAZ95_07460 [Trinickia violacea]